MTGAKLPRFPASQQDWVLLYCRVMALFVVQGGILLVGAVFVVINLIVDLLYLAADPRLRLRAQ